VNVTALRSIYRIKITLQHTTPPIWRRLLVPTGTKLDRLHTIIQEAMGWSDSHLHQFIYRGESYGSPDPDSPSNCTPESTVRIEDLLAREKSVLLYEYDFGDWMHEIVLEKIMPFTKETAVPVCIDGAGACPPEDSGGLFGYKNMLKILGDPAHPDYEDTWEWIGGDDFDPDHFDIDAANAALKQ
jgi:hypothetical protein